MLKVLLINPTRKYTDKSSYISKGADIGLPLGLLYIAAAMEGKCNVEIIDSLLHKETKVVKNEGSLEYGIPWLKLKKIVEEKNPDIVGIGNLFSTQIGNAIKSADIVKEVNKDILTVIGGAHVSVMTKEFMTKANSCDIAIIGEGEETINDIIRWKAGKIDIGEIEGIAYKRDGRVIVNKKREFIQNLDTLPFPAYHLVDMEAYLSLYKKGIYSRSRDEKRAVSMITSRGCPFNCVFCSVHASVGKLWRAHSAEYVIKHISHLVEKYNVEEIHFEDDNFTLNIERCEKILDGITPLKIRWDTPNGIRADIYSKSLVAKMKESGCKSITIAIESGSQRVLDQVIGKKLDLNKVEGFAKLCKDYKIPVTAFYVIGFPGEKKEDMDKTIKFALNLQNKYGVNQGGAFFATPIYGTRLYDICENNGYFTKEITPEALADATASYGEGLIKTEDFSPEDLKVFNQVLIRANYIKHLKNPVSQIKLFIKDPKILLKIVKRFIGIK